MKEQLKDEISLINTKLNDHKTLDNEDLEVLFLLSLLEEENEK